MILGVVAAMAHGEVVKGHGEDLVTQEAGITSRVGEVKVTGALHREAMAV